MSRISLAQLGEKLIKRFYNLFRRIAYCSFETKWFSVYLLDGLINSLGFKRSIIVSVKLLLGKWARSRCQNKAAEFSGLKENQDLPSGYSVTVILSLIRKNIRAKSAGKIISTAVKIFFRLTMSQFFQRRRPNCLACDIFKPLLWCDQQCDKLLLIQRH